jgi:type III secretory pathway component EscR
MNPFLIALLAMIAVALIVAGVGAVALLRSVLAISRHAKALQQHPTVVALRSLEATKQRFTDLPAKVQEIRARCADISQIIGELMATSTLLQLQVDRVGFATELLLKTLVPTLRGSMSD